MIHCELKLIAIENDPARAVRLEQAGIHRVFVDLEFVGKKERQRKWDAALYQHSIESVIALRKVLRRAELLVRVNPLSLDSPEELDRVIAAGADIVMLPMFCAPEEVVQFLSIIGGRVRTSLLFETPQALTRLSCILAARCPVGAAKDTGTGRYSFFDEAYVGLNDLSLGMGLDFVFEPLAGGLIDFAAEQLSRYEVPFGFGGLGRIDGGLIPGKHILREHIRLGSSMVILSRAFFEGLGPTDAALHRAVAETAQEASVARTRTLAVVQQDKKITADLIWAAAAERRRGLGADSK